MRYNCKIRALAPIIMHSIAGALDTASEIYQLKKAITDKRGPKTEAESAELRKLETLSAIWWNEKHEPTIPGNVIRANIEQAARKLKQGPAVREGLVVESGQFHYDKKRSGASIDEISEKAQFTVPVRVQRNSILRTRAIFHDWSAEFILHVDDTLIDESNIREWLNIGGHRIGVGDWRPATSGEYGRYELESIEAVKD